MTGAATLVFADMVADGSFDGLLGRRTPEAVMAARVHEAAEERLWDGFSDRLNPWAAGARMAAKRFGIEPEIAAAGIAHLDGVYARVETDPEDARRFRLAPAAQRTVGEPAVLFRYQAETPEFDDVLALSLVEGSSRFWRLTCKLEAIGDRGPDARGVLVLRQNPYGYFRALIKAAANEAAAKREGDAAVAAAFEDARFRSGLANAAEALQLPIEDPARQAYLQGLKAALRARADIEARWKVSTRSPDGTLVLDPAAVDWTRRGALADVEWIEIADAPAGGALGRALQTMNPRIGTKTGVALVGQEPPRKGQRRAA